MSTEKSTIPHGKSPLSQKRSAGVFAEKCVNTDRDKRLRDMGIELTDKVQRQVMSLVGTSDVALRNESWHVAGITHVLAACALSALI